MIDRLHLTNVLAFRELTLDMRALTLLSGTNSAGKTSVLHALALLRQSEWAGTLGETLLLNGQEVQLGTGRDVLHNDTVGVAEIDGVAVSIGLDVGDESRRWTARYEQDADVLQIIGSPTTEPLFAKGFQYLKADRIVPAVTFPKSHEAVVKQRALGASGEHAPNYLRVWGETPTVCEPARHPAAIGNALRDQVNAWLDDLSPGTRVAVADVQGTDFVRLEFTRTGPDVRSEAHRATNVGFGLTYVLPVLVATLMAAADQVLLVENPEAHLHPRGQALVGRLCALAAAGGAQVIVETHSDHVLNAIRIAVKRGELAADHALLHFFTRSSETLQPAHTQMELSEEGMIERWPAGFFDQWDEAIDELLDE